MSIYSDFEARLDASKMEARTKNREASLALAENPGGDPLLGIQYSCDFRSEEERGAGQMTELFTRAAKPKSFLAKEYLLQDESKGPLDGVNQADLVFENEELVAFSAKLHSYDIERELAEALKFIRQMDAFKDGRADLRWKYRQSTSVEMKAELKARGIKGYSKLKVDELETLLVDDDYSKANPNGDAESYSQPGWFHYGSLLVFEKKDNLFGAVIQRLVAAANAGQLVVGGGGVGAFGSGFSLFDARDLSAQAEAEITENNRWHREQMELLKPVAEVVKAGPMRGSWGGAYYFLGNPTPMHGEVKYWLNGHGVRFPNGRSVQPFGWYSLQELLDEKYMEDAKLKSDEDVKSFKDGNYRKVKLTDEEAEAELKARGLSWASKPMAED